MGQNVDSDEPLDSGEPVRTRRPLRASDAPVSGQLRFFQVLSMVLLAILLIGGGYYWYRLHRAQPVTILVKGQPVATVDSYADATDLLKRITVAQLGEAYSADAAPRVTEPIQFQRVPSSTPIDSLDAAASKLSTKAHITVLADVILIDGHPSVALPDEKTAQTALDAVQRHYSDMPPSDSILGTPSFREQVTIERHRVPIALCKPSAEAAAQALLTPPPGKTYAVQFHDTGWLIARKFHMPFSDFIRANSGRDLDHLTPGDTVSISQTFPALTVIVHKTTSKREAIVPGASAADAGERDVTEDTTYVNGVRTGRPVPMNVYTVRRAVPRRMID